MHSTYFKMIPLAWSHYQIDSVPDVASVVLIALRKSEAQKVMHERLALQLPNLAGS